MIIRLAELDKNLKHLLLVYLIVVFCGLCVGLVYLWHNTNLSVNGTIEHFNGSVPGKSQDEMDFPEKYPKPFSELLITTHNHILGMSFVFFTIGLIFYLSSIVSGWLKTFLLIEPLISVAVTFGSIWGIRYLHPGFVILTLFSSILMYFSVFFMIILSIYELLLVKKEA